MTLSDKFITRIKTKNLFSKGDRLLLAVSGGVDSMVLLELMRGSGYDFEVAHCNFQLRGLESDADECCVLQVCERSNVKLHVKKFDTEAYAQQNKLGIQVAARNLRYRWFNELLEERHFNWILTAHHANDNIETMMMNFFKGTGITGLRGMKEKGGGIGGRLIRPLLTFHKNEIREFADSYGLVWREDASNNSSKYTRNFFRNEVLPFVSTVYPEAEVNLMNNLRRFSDAAVIYKEAVENIISKLIEKKDEEIHIPVLKLIKSTAYESVYYEIISRYGFGSDQLTDALKLLHSETGKYIQSNTHRIIRNRQWIVIAPLAVDSVNIHVIEAPGDLIRFGDKTISVKLVSALQEWSKDASRVSVDADNINFPMVLRRWKQGDYFYPLGMTKKKKLSRFFIDNKLSVSDKEKVWILESEKRIIWVLGMRIDDRFKIKPSTKKILSLQLLPAQ